MGFGAAMQKWCFVGIRSETTAATKASYRNSSNNARVETNRVIGWQLWTNIPQYQHHQSGEFPRAREGKKNATATTSTTPFDLGLVQCGRHKDGRHYVLRFYSLSHPHLSGWGMKYSPKGMRLPPMPRIADIIRLYGLSAKKQLSQNFILDFNVAGIFTLRYSVSAWCRISLKFSKIPTLSVFQPASSARYKAS